MQHGPYLSLRLLSAVYPICNFRLFALALDSSITDQLRMVLVILFRLLSCLLTKRSRIWLFLLLVTSLKWMRYLLHTLPPSIPYTAAIHVFLLGFIRGSLPCLFLVRSTLYLYYLSGFWLISESPLCYLIVRRDFWERHLFIISSVFEYETGWAFHNVVSYY